MFQRGVRLFICDGQLLIFSGPPIARFWYQLRFFCLILPLANFTTLTNMYRIENCVQRSFTGVLQPWINEMGTISVLHRYIKKDLGHFPKQSAYSQSLSQACGITPKTAYQRIAFGESTHITQSKVSHILLPLLKVIMGESLRQC